MVCDAPATHASTEPACSSSSAVTSGPAGPGLTHCSPARSASARATRSPSGLDSSNTMTGSTIRSSASRSIAASVRGSAVSGKATRRRARAARWRRFVTNPRSVDVSGAPGGPSPLRRSVDHDSNFERSAAATLGWTRSRTLPP